MSLTWQAVLLSSSLVGSRFIVCDEEVNGEKNNSKQSEANNMNASHTRWAVGAAAILMAAGCTVLKSTKVGHDAENVKPEQREGIAYSLPTAMIHIKAVLSTTDKTTTPTNNPPKKPDAPANPGDKSGGTNDTTRLSSAAAGTNAPAERAQTTSEANVSATGTGDADQQPPN